LTVTRSDCQPSLQYRERIVVALAIDWAGSGRMVTGCTKGSEFKSGAVGEAIEFAVVIAGEAGKVGVETDEFICVPETLGPTGRAQVSWTSPASLADSEAEFA
jgi:hypothetical protein